MENGFTLTKEEEEVLSMFLNERGNISELGDAVRHEYKLAEAVDALEKRFKEFKEQRAKNDNA